MKTTLKWNYDKNQWDYKYNIILQDLIVIFRKKHSKICLGNSKVLIDSNVFLGHSDTLKGKLKMLYTIFKLLRSNSNVKQ